MNQYSFDRACGQLSAFVHMKAMEILRGKEEMLEASRLAPACYTGILEEYAYFKEGTPFRVSDVDSGSIYKTPRHNHYFRLWHDVCHATMKLDLSYEHEYLVALHHVHEVGEMLGHGSPATKLMRIDTLSQLEHFNKHGEFVTDQLAFARALFYED